MRAYGISVGILAAILVFSLWNSSYMTASTVRWREQLQQADAQAQSEAWTEAVDTLAGSYDDWSESQTYLHIVARHDTVDDAEAMYRRALAFAATRADGVPGGDLGPAGSAPAPGGDGAAGYQERPLTAFTGCRPGACSALS